MLVAGVDIGNSTTEVLLAELGGAGLAILETRRAWTVGRKGDEESVMGAGRLVLAAERALGRRCDLLLTAPPEPVLTLSAAIPPPPAPPAPLRVLNRRSASTPAGSGSAVGACVGVRELGARDGREAIVASVPLEVDFEEAAQAVAAAQGRGLPVVGAVVASDDAVLIANRVPHSIPIVDEADVGSLRDGEPVAVEVAAPGVPMRVLNDPIALAAAFGLPSSSAAELSDFARGLADARCGAVALQRDDAPGEPAAEPGFLVYEGEAGLRRAPLSRRVVEHQDLIRPGMVREIEVPPGTPLHRQLYAVRDLVRDLFAVDLPSIRRDFSPRVGSIELEEVPLSVLVVPAEGAPAVVDVLAEQTGRPVHVPTSEAKAAALGALTTPGARSEAAVCDMGGGTIHVVHGAESVTAAGAGELLTVAVARALGLAGRAAEYVKRYPCFRVEAPQMVHYEDGTRGFAERALPAEALGRLCFMSGATPVPFSSRLSPEEWRGLRLAIKKHVIGASVSRALRWLEGRPRMLLLCGGAALDAESVRAVGEAVGEGVTVGRANVAGTMGPRHAVALGLVHAFRDSESR
jgi:diol dehydratase reactivase alpha subunit